jgi:D-hexose-6-phosphate mutarotase
MPLLQRDQPYPHWEFSDPLSGDLLRLVPERGGLVAGWRAGGEEQLYLDGERFQDPSRSVRGGIPVLFPICGPLPSGSLPLPQHGFARDLPWTLLPLEDGQGVLLELCDSDLTRARYPYAFRLAMEVRLAPSELEFCVTVENRTAQVMPFSFGLHPYFAVTSLDGVRVEGLPERALDQTTFAEVESAQQIDLMAEGIDLLAHPAGPVRLVDASARRVITLDCAAPLDLVVIWSDPPRPMLCVEPWTAPRGALLSGERRLDLSAGESLQLQTRFRVSRS